MTRMKSAALIVLAAATAVAPMAAFAAAPKAATKKAVQHRRSAAKSPSPAARRGALTLPAGAREIEPDMYAYTDPAGKRWIYRTTPFGLFRNPENAGPAASANVSAGGPVRHNTPFGAMTARASNIAPPSSSDRPGADPAALTTVKELGGDELRFERQSPFGAMTWTRKKTALNEFERQVWERSRSGASAAGTPASGPTPAALPITTQP
jgi:hypothetical protein